MTRKSEWIFLILYTVVALTNVKFMLYNITSTKIDWTFSVIPAIVSCKPKKNEVDIFDLVVMLKMTNIGWSNKDLNIKKRFTCTKGVIEVDLNWLDLVSMEVRSKSAS